VRKDPVVNVLSLLEFHIADEVTRIRGDVVLAPAQVAHAFGNTSRPHFRGLGYLVFAKGVRPGSVEPMGMAPRKLSGWKLAALSLAVAAGVVGPAPASIPENPPPARLWAVGYDGPANGLDSAFSVGVSPDGSKVFVTGQSTGLGSYTDYLTVAYSAATGSGSWAARYNGPGNYLDDASALAVSPDGSKVFVTGLSAGSFGDYDYATVAYSAATGAQLWLARYQGLGTDRASALAVSADGSKVFVTGKSASSFGYYDYATAAYSAATGAPLWSARYEGPSDDGATALAVSPDGSKVFVTGRSAALDNDADFLTLAYSAATGAQLWTVRNSGDDGATALAVSPDGSKVFVTGSRTSLERRYYETIAYSAGTGARLWFAGYPGLGSSGGNSGASSLGVSPDGSKLFVTGSSSGDLATVAYSAADGAQLWDARYNGAANGYATASSLGVSPNGSKVFVTGYGLGSTGSVDFLTTVYAAANGVPLWAAQHSGPGNSSDYAFSLRVSPDGSKVFVAGGGNGVGGSRDYVTVAYRAASCANGRDEMGQVSGLIHGTVEPFSDPATAHLHGVNCDVVAANGL
jgi:WD40 repeat protein